MAASKEAEWERLSIPGGRGRRIEQEFVFPRVPQIGDGDNEGGGRDGTRLAGRRRVLVAIVGRSDGDPVVWNDDKCCGCVVVVWCVVWRREEVWLVIEVQREPINGIKQGMRSARREGQSLEGGTEGGGRTAGGFLKSIQVVAAGCVGVRACVCAVVICPWLEKNERGACVSVCVWVWEKGSGTKTGGVKIP